MENADNAIQENLSLDIQRGIMSSNIIDKLRNLIESIMYQIYEKDNNIKTDNNYDNLKTVINYCKSRARYKLIVKFRDFVQIANSHQKLDFENSERLMLKYYEYMYELRKFYKEEFDGDILSNLESYPIDQDETMLEYFNKIGEVIGRYKLSNHGKNLKKRYYVEKTRPFLSEGIIYYEVTLTPSTDSKSKFDRFIVYSKYKINSNYAIRANFIEDKISLLDINVPIKILTNWMISIRPCEINNLSKYFNMNLDYRSETRELKEIMIYLTNNNLDLLDLALMSNEEFKNLKTFIHSIKNIGKVVFKLLENCREIILNNKPGQNIIRYMLHTMRNVVIKKQYMFGTNGFLSNLSIQYGSIQFDDTPLCWSLLGHNPKLSTLYDCIPIEGLEYQLLARKIKYNTEQEAMLYTKTETLIGFEDIESLVKEYNDSLYYTHKPHSEIIISEDNNYLYINGYQAKTISILNIIKKINEEKIDYYSESVIPWLEEYDNIDDPYKKEIVKKIFSNSKVAAIYGSAGTGKTTLINYIANFFKDHDKLFLANTNTAVDNLRNRVDAQNSMFSTVSKNIYNPKSVGLLIVDESSTINNRDMLNVLTKNDYELLIVVGDTHQIQSIEFGNWFHLLKKVLPTSSYELTTPYRTQDDKLIKLWEKARTNDELLTEYMGINNYSSELDSTIFDYTEEEQVILCLNYDGLYGINNINRMLQIKNPNPSFEWGVWHYKVGDPVIFNETARFPKVIHNNLKGTIKNIIVNEETIYFEVEIPKALNEFFLDNGLKLIESKDGKSTIGFTVKDHTNTDLDDESIESVVPFQVAYAMSIHKAQGLEYNSVKIVMTSEVEERITHNIFYTAITRARKFLKIYWTPESQQKILKNFNIRDINNEYWIIKRKLISDERER